MVTLRLIRTLWEINNRDMKTIYHGINRLPASGQDCMGLTHTLEQMKVGSDAASWAKMLEQGLALQRKAQGESGGHQSPPTAGAAWRGAVPTIVSMVEAGLHAGRVILLSKLGSTAAAEVLRLEHDRGQGVCGRLTQPTPGAAGTYAVLPPSERSDGDSSSREGGVFPPTLSPAGTSLAGGRRCGRRGFGRSITVGAVRTGLGRGNSNPRSNS